jgi:WD40 repeat protein
MTPITEVAFSPDGRLLAASGYWAKEVRLFDLENRRLLRAVPNTSEGHERWARCWQGAGFVFAPDGRSLLIGGKDNALHFWDIAAGREQWALSESKEPVLNVALTSDGHVAMTAHYGGEVHLWNVAEGKHIRKLPTAAKYPHLTALSLDGKTVALSAGSKEIELDDSEGGLRHKIATRSKVVGLGFSADGATLHLAQGEEVTNWDVISGKQLGAMAAIDAVPGGSNDQMGPKIEAWFRPDARFMAWTRGNSVRRFDLSTGKEMPQLPGLRLGLQWAGFSVDGKQLYLGGTSGAFGAWEWETGKPRGDMHRLGPGEFGRFVPFCNRQKIAITTLAWTVSPSQKPHNCRVLVWDPVANSVAVVLPEVGGPGAAVVPTPDDRFLVTAEEGMIRVFDAPSGRLVRSFAGRKSEFWPRFSPDGAVLATFGGGKFPMSIQLYDFATGRPVRELRGASNAVRAAFSPDGRWLASGHAADPLPESRGTPGDFIYIWDRTSDRQIRRFLTGHGYITDLVFSSDGRLIASCGHDHIVRLWEATSGQLRCKYKGHTNWVNSIDFSPDGQRLVSASSDATAVVWRVFDQPDRRADLNAAWTHLQKDGETAHRAIAVLVANGETVSFLSKRLTPAGTPNEVQVQNWLADLRSPHFAVREAAEKELGRIGEQAEPIFRRAQQSSSDAEVRRRLESLQEKVVHPETRPEQLRALRAVEVLERIGTDDAKRILAQLATGDSDARLTQDAKASLQRLQK